MLPFSFLSIVGIGVVVVVVSVPVSVPAVVAIVVVVAIPVIVSATIASHNTWIVLVVAWEPKTVVSSHGI